MLWEARGTDLLLTVGMPPQARVHGELHAVPNTSVLTADDTDALLAEVLTATQTKAGMPAREYDFSFSWRDDARIRGNAFTQRGTTAVALRMIPREIPTMAQLGLPPVLGDFARQHQGLVLVTGPTGSGKSTTLASIIDQINTDRACHIITIEDPIEYVHQHKRSAVNQREVGSDTGVVPRRAARRAPRGPRRPARRRDARPRVDPVRPDRSPRPATSSSPRCTPTTPRSRSPASSTSSPAEQQAQVRVQLAAALSGIVYQRLIPRIGGGLVAAYEVLVADTAVRNLIKEGKTHQLRNCAGHRPARRHGHLRAVAVGAGASRQVTYEDAVARSLYPKDIEARPRLARERAGMRRRKQHRSRPPPDPAPAPMAAARPADLGVKPGGVRLGELLVDAGLATREQVVGRRSSQRSAARASGSGELLVERGALDERDLATRLARQHGARRRRPPPGHARAGRRRPADRERWRAR